MGVGAELQICCLLWFVCAGADLSVIWTECFVLITTARIGKDGAVVNDFTVNGNQGRDGNLHARDTDCAPLPSSTSDNGQPMTLQLRDRPAAQSTQRDKQYPPVVTLVYNAGQVICSAQANPLAFSYRIILNGTIVLRTFNTSGQPLNFEPDFCTTVGCNVTNTLGTGAQRLPYPICPGSTGPDADVIVIVIGTILIFTGVVSALLVLHCARRRTHKIEPSRNNDESHRRTDDRLEAQSELVEGNNWCDTTQGTDLGFPRDLVMMEKELGRGVFGRLFLATAHGIDEAGKDTKVVVKTVIGCARTDEDTGGRLHILAELDLMKEICSHPNVIRLLGFCVETDPVYIIVEHCSKGDLRSVLLQYRDTELGKAYCRSGSEPESSGPLSRTLVGFARDVANGMAFLSSKKYVLCDLTSSKVLVGDDYSCKLADFRRVKGVTAVYADVCETNLESRPPFRWLAPETYEYGIFSTASDVWSFGVVLWEILTLGKKPYAELGMSGMPLADRIATGYRLPKPRNCGQTTYAMMLSCWKNKPQDRPDFQHLLQQLDGMLSRQEVQSILTEHSPH